jgi:hypothetical protein
MVTACLEEITYMQFTCHRTYECSKRTQMIKMQTFQLCSLNTPTPQELSRLPLRVPLPPVERNADVVHSLVTTLTELCGSLLRKQGIWSFRPKRFCCYVIHVPWVGNLTDEMSRMFSEISDMGDITSPRMLRTESSDFKICITVWRWYNRSLYYEPDSTWNYWGF